METHWFYENEVHQKDQAGYSERIETFKISL